MLDQRLDALRADVKRLGSVLVAFSGGADSAFLLATAAEVLGPAHVVAATAVSPSLPAAELAAAGELAAALGVDHRTPVTHELDRPGYVRNGPDRCAWCKGELMAVLVPLAAEVGMAAVATGTNADDAADPFRPGIRAAAARGARTPLRDAGLTKADVREASRRMGLATWDKPAAACLSSRLAYGVEVTADRLRRVEHAEVAVRAALGDAGVEPTDLRVRDLGDAARVEVDAGLVPLVTGLPAVVDAVRGAGFATVEVDPRGFRSGSMNDALRERPASTA